MPDLTTSAAVDAFMTSADKAAMRSNIGIDANNNNETIGWADTPISRHAAGIIEVGGVIFPQNVRKPMTQGEFEDELRNAVKYNRPAQIRGVVQLTSTLDLSDVLGTNRHGGIVIQGGGSLQRFYQPGGAEDDQDVYATGFTAIQGDQAVFGASDPLILTTGENIVWRDLSFIGRNINRDDGGARLISAVQTNRFSGWPSGSSIYDACTFQHFDFALVNGTVTGDLECDQMRTRDCTFLNLGTVMRLNNWQSVDHHFGGMNKINSVDTIFNVGAGGKITADTLSIGRVKTIFNFELCSDQVNYFDVRAISVDANKGNPCVARIQSTLNAPSPSVHIDRMIAINNNSVAEPNEPLVVCDGFGANVEIDRSFISPAPTYEINSGTVNVKLNGADVVFP